MLAHKEKSTCWFNIGICDILSCNYYNCVFKRKENTQNMKKTSLQI